MMEENNDEILFEKMREGLDSIDNMKVKTPNMEFFRKMVAEAEEKKKVKSKRETIIFMISAIAILSLETYAFNQSIIFFAIIQSIALISIPITLFAMLRRKKGQVDSL